MLLLSLLVAGAQAKKVTLFYNVYAQPRRTTRAFAIVDEQLRAFRRSPLGPATTDVRFATIGDRATRGRVEALCGALNFTCVHLGHSSSGDEGNTLEPLHAFCRARPEGAVAYLHDKGSFRDNPQNTLLRRNLLRGLASPAARYVL